MDSKNYGVITLNNFKSSKIKLCSCKDYNECEHMNLFSSYITDGSLSKLDGPAEYYIFNNIKYSFYWINSNFCSKPNFAYYTNHIVCNMCLDFCNQGCFL